jgi:hypothetical protein
MKFEVSDPIPFTLDDAFLLIRDRMPTLVPYMRDTEAIEVISRTEEGDQTLIVNRWTGSQDRVPKMLRGVLKPDLLTWLDHATWSESNKEAQWRLEAMGGKTLFSCTGTTSFHVQGGETYLKIVVDLEIYPEKIPGVPKLLARKFSGQIEKFLGDLLSDNMRQLAKSMSNYARDHQ